MSGPKPQPKEVSRPAQLPVRWTTYFSSRPFWFLFLGATYVGPLTYAFLTRNNLWAIAALAFTMVIWMRLRAIHTAFGWGQLYPATVISRNPLLIGVLTDFTPNSETNQPALQVIAPPAARSFLGLGTRLAVVSTSPGFSHSRTHLAITANDEPRVQRDLLNRIHEREWSALERACYQVPLPPKCGFYPLPDEPRR